VIENKYRRKSRKDKYRGSKIKVNNGPKRDKRNSERGNGREYVEKNEERYKRRHEK
jgi:hypothetical protein